MPAAFLKKHFVQSIQKSIKMKSTNGLETESILLQQLVVFFVSNVCFPSSRTSTAHTKL